MLNVGQSRQYSVRTDWDGSHPCCYHFEWSLPSMLTVLLNHFHFAFFSFFGGIMPLNLQEQILVCNIRLSAEGYSQWEVKRMLGVSQGCISKILPRNRDTSQTYQWRRGGQRSLSAAREGRQLIRMVRDNRFISPPRVEMIRRFRSRLSIRSIVDKLLVASYRSAVLAQQGVEVMDCPARSPNMKPGERVWEQMGLWIRDMCQNCGVPSSNRGLQFAQEGCGPWWSACHIVCMLFSPPKGDHTKYQWCGDMAVSLTYS